MQVDWKVISMNQCKDCYYNFYGICANHCYFEIFAIITSGDFSPVNQPDLYVDSEIDPYGYNIADLQKHQYTCCFGYRKDFLKRSDG